MIAALAVAACTALLTGCDSEPISHELPEKNTGKAETSSQAKTTVTCTAPQKSTTTYTTTIKPIQKKLTYADPNDPYGLSKSQQEANAIYIHDYLSKKGWSSNAICGLLGNMQRESHLNPAAWQDGYQDDKYSNYCGYGLVQFTPACDFLPQIGYTVENIGDFAQSNPNGLIDLQLEYIIKTSQPGAGYFYSDDGFYGSPYSMSFNEFISSDYDPGELALVFHGHYERSADDEITRNERVEYANNWYSYFNP